MRVARSMTTGGGGGDVVDDDDGWFVLSSIMSTVAGVALVFITADRPAPPVSEPDVVGLPDRLKPVRGLVMLGTVGFVGSLVCVVADDDDSPTFGSDEG